MRRYIQFIFLLLAVISANGQKERNIWCFGQYAGLDFNSGTPVVLNTDINTMEGSSAIADSNGNLLFYSDGVSVWNKNNVMMPNGTGLHGGPSSTESALIVKAPGNNTIYYVFTVSQSLDTTGFQYSTVDMSLLGGLGDVVVKNVPVRSRMTEKLCGIRHANGTDVWIMVHAIPSNGFYAYLLTGTGLSATPVISYTGTRHDTITGGGNEIGYMKFSPDGRKIACAVRDQKFYELFDFNNATGVVDNPIHFTSNAICYGVEFSPDNLKIYFTGDDGLFQADLSSNDSAIITASRQLISASVQFAVQLAPDDKIYIAMDGNTLSVINDPNVAGAGCGFSLNALSLGAVSSNLGLPNMIPYYAVTLPPPVASLQSSDSSLCTGDCISFKDLSTNYPYNWYWTFEGGSPDSSTLQNPPSVCYLAPGSFPVTLMVTNSSGSDTITLTNFINVLAAPPTPTITQFDSLLYCHSDSGYISYQWYDSTALIPGATDTFLIAGRSGNYNLKVKNANGCSIGVGANIVIGIAEAGLMENSVSFYPNPVKEEFAISGLWFSVKEARIYNVLGQEAASPPATLHTSTLLSDQRRGESAMIDVSALPPGMYFIRLWSESGSVVRKFVKE